MLDLGVACLDRLDEGELLFLNLHPSQLGHPEQLAEHLSELLPHTDRIVLEITEREDLTTIQRWEESIALIRDRGFSVAIDDLGAGYSSLAMLADLEPQFMKLDMGLVRAVDRNARRRRIITLLQRFGDATGTRVIAEGVETVEEMRALRDCGVTLMQGFHFALPDLDTPPDA